MRENEIEQLRETNRRLNRRCQQLERELCEQGKTRDYNAHQLECVYAAFTKHGFKMSPNGLTAYGAVEEACSKLAVARAALEKIATMDYRGNQPVEASIAREGLEKSK